VREESTDTQRKRWRSLAVIVLVIISALLIFVGNVFFWAGNTVAKTDRYVATVAPLVDDPDIQTAVATYATDQIYNNVDVEPIIAQTLPPRAAFLAPTLATQLESQTKNVLNKVVASPKFKQAWVNSQRKTHENLITIATKADGDGKINLSEAYQFLSAQLKGTPLSFLADKPLPSNVGSITLVHAKYLPAFHKLVTKIDTWRIIAISLFAITAVAAVWLSRHRRRTTITLGLSYALIMFLTLVSMRIGREVAANSVDAQYQTAVQHAYQIVMHQLATQTFVIMLTALLVAAIAWISGPSRSARMITDRINTLLSGHLHSALFGTNENRFTLWVGKYKRVLQWTSVAIIGVIMLFSRLAPKGFVLFTTIMLVSVLIVEALAAPLKSGKK
jgi:hypothetical protein